MSHEEGHRRTDEAKRIVRVTSKGEKVKKLKCPAGFKLSDSGTSCVPIKGSEKLAKKQAIKKAIRTKKAKGDAFKVRTTKKRLKALKKRKAFGL